jgi:hypothetical protein
MPPLSGGLLYFTPTLVWAYLLESGITLKFQLLSIQFTSEVFETGRKMSEMA